jgi:arylsulfatase A-like enzyme
MNILFIMYDQLRFDYLSCAGHPHLHTPNFDRLAEMGVRFSEAYVQSPICGASRMSFYTGRYASSHGAQWNGFPLRVGEVTLGDHLRKLGMDSWLLGKTHMKVDAEGMTRLGLSPDSVIGARQSECGFDAFIRDDGLWGAGPDGFYDSKRSPYNEYLKSKGYDGDNPWADYANAGVDADGNMASGWMFMNADKQANIREEDSETPWLTSETIRFLDQAKGNWLAHVSFIKPHWPYIVPAPYHDMFGPNNVPAPRRHATERSDPHPVYGAFMNNKIAQAFQRDEVREKVIPAYMGLIKQCDDQLGRLLDHLGSDRADGGHDDRGHLRPWRLSRRPLAWREGPVPRTVGEDPADHLRSAPRGRRHPRHHLRRAGREHRPGRNICRSGRRHGARPYHRGPFADALAAMA